MELWFVIFRVVRLLMYIPGVEAAKVIATLAANIVSVCYKAM